MAAITPDRFVADLSDAWQRLDAARILDAYAPDARLDHSGFVMTGREEIRPFVEALCGSLEEVAVERRQVAASGPAICALVHLSGRFARDLDLMGTTWPTRGKSFDLDFADFVTLDDQGKVREETQIHDSLPLFAQLKIPPQRVATLMEQQSAR